MKIQLIGNERAVRSMEAHVKSSSPAPLLISGETGLGQEELAMAAASELLNTERPEADGNFFMLRPENGSIRVEAVEELLDRSRISAHRGVRKVFAIIGIGYMTIQAQNRLLKLLEDRNDKNVLLMTKDGGLVLDTIVSRAVNIRLVRLPKAQMEEYLKETGEKEDAVVLEAVMRGCPYRYPEVKKQIEIFRDIYARQLEIKSKADILYLFHEVKEKDKDSFYIKHRDKMFGLLNLEYSIYEELLLLEEGALKEPSDERYVNLRKFYEVEDIYRILTTIIQQKKRLENPGQYTRNDFVDLLRNLCR